MCEQINHNMLCALLIFMSNKVSALI